jgi:hypothetical protein
MRAWALALFPLDDRDGGKKRLECGGNADIEPCAALKDERRQ